MTNPVTIEYIEGGLESVEKSRFSKTAKIGPETRLGILHHLAKFGRNFFRKFFEGPCRAVHGSQENEPIQRDENHKNPENHDFHTPITFYSHIGFKNPLEHKHYCNWAAKWPEGFFQIIFCVNLCV